MTCLLCQLAHVMLWTCHRRRIRLRSPSPTMQSTTVYSTWNSRISLVKQRLLFRTEYGVVIYNTTLQVDSSVWNGGAVFSLPSFSLLRLGVLCNSVTRGKRIWAVDLRGGPWCTAEVGYEVRSTSSCMPWSDLQMRACPSIKGR